MNQYPPNPQYPYPPQPQYPQYPPPQGQWQGQPPMGAPQPPQGTRKALGLLLILTVMTLPALCGVGMYIEQRDTTKGPGDEVATANVTANVPVSVQYRYEGSVRRRFSVWLRHGSSSSAVRGLVSCRDTSAAYANFSQMFPPTTTLFEPEPGIVWIGGSLITGNNTITCEGTISEPSDFVGRLVITEHVPRPSDILGL